ncbi:MAG TPA: SPFH domain-containing protein [Clostridiaceae bacterium]|mgnify:CR=1 FL=1|nr:SPFH domain-containing protein [Clostridiaceae bacterium]
MGLIKAITGAIGGTLADQWKEFFYCEALENDVLVKKGQKVIGGRSSNTKGSDNIISNGSGIAVADGQCMIIVDQGKVVDVCAEPGEYTYDTSTEPSIFSGKFGESLLNTFKTIGRRFTFGGDTGRDQRVYYFNTKEILDNKFGTPNPIPFRVVDRNIGLDIDVAVRCSGVYSYEISDPILFYTNVTGNVQLEYTRDQIDNQLKTEFVSALQPAFAEISTMQVRPSELPGHAGKLADLMNIELTKKWSELRGLKIVSVALNPITLPEEDAELIKQAQRAGMLRDPSMAGATLVGAQADAMKAAAANEAGAMTGFMGFGMAQQAGGAQAKDLFAMGQQNQQNTQVASQQATGGQPGIDSWTCPKCGNVASGKFCTECGGPKPEQGWQCTCGTVNQGKFCHNCGKAKPEGAPLYKCDKCGFEPKDPQNPPKFCPECGDPFDENDIL